MHQCALCGCRRALTTFQTSYDPSYATAPAPSADHILAGSEHTQLDSTECSYYSCDHSADYIGTASDGETNLTSDGVIYPAYTPFSGAEAGNSTTQLYGLDLDHTGDYIGSDGSLLGDGTIYPAQETATGNSTVMLCPDHSGAHYCTEPDADCSTDIVDPVLEPIVYPELALPMATAAPAPKKGAKEAPARPGPGHMLLMGPALIFGELFHPSNPSLPLLDTGTTLCDRRRRGHRTHTFSPRIICAPGATEATAKMLMRREDSSSWMADFQNGACKAADAVTPVGGFLLKKTLA